MQVASFDDAALWCIDGGQYLKCGFESRSGGCRHSVSFM
ncbi:hypothetical protein WQQ_37670 [Hydrocarboniphaga effusa AP103]|uniref:Uncharacterized protein n=1 Tax=Hydrocarboniphaga effusa AP103 TaxID=1172194 RepID=I7ZA89_9GAMM|nr:hypothetical protein WQQ_37670 [Hydrocarboniphaga effusa AP103]